MVNIQFSIAALVVIGIEALSLSALVGAEATFEKRQSEVVTVETILEELATVGSNSSVQCSTCDVR